MPLTVSCSAQAASTTERPSGPARCSCTARSAAAHGAKAEAKAGHAAEVEALEQELAEAKEQGAAALAAAREEVAVLRADLAEVNNARSEGAIEAAKGEIESLQTTRAVRSD